MANVKQIKINDTVYDVEDSAARSALQQKSPLESPALTGTPTAPTATKGTNTTQIATTAFVQNAVQGAGSSYTLPVASPTTLGGVKPVAKTASMTQEVGVDASGALYTEPGSGGGVKSVNGETGDVKSVFYVTVTPTGSGYSATADKTAAEVYAAYVAGYAVYAIVNFNGVHVPFELPLVAAVPFFETFVLGFGALGSLDPTANPQYPTVTYTGTAWMAWLGTLARSEDIPTIPTELKNPYSLNIKSGDTTTSYDGSAAKTVEIPEGVPPVSAADNGKFLRVVSGAWAAVEIANANGGSF